MVRSDYLILIAGVMILDCCADRKAEIEKTHKVDVLAYGENIKPGTMRHCLLGCLHHKPLKGERKTP